jgi:hypothetical protein
MTVPWFYDSITWAAIAIFSGLNLLVLWASGPRSPRTRARFEVILFRLTGRRDLAWLTWWPVWVAAVTIFGGVAAYGFISGQYACLPSNDAYGLWASGAAFRSGADPFHVTVCGGPQTVPYGLAAVLIDALGSLGGVVGIYVVWGAVAFLLVPLVWSLAGNERRAVLVYLATSVLFVPLIASQIDGATNALVPVVVLVSLYLARRRGWFASVVGGFLSTARFPSVFPLMGSAGDRPASRILGAALVGATFAAVTALSYLRWGMSFLDTVFLDQFARRSFSLNAYGILLLRHELPVSLALELAQAALTIALTLIIAWKVRPPLLAAALILTGLTLLTPFLSYNILVWLLPVALVGARARWWLWGIGAVGAVNYSVAYVLWARVDGILWPSSLLDLVLTGLLIALFVELCRVALRPEAPGGTERSATPD